MNKAHDFKIKGRIWIYSDNGTVIGEGRLKLLIGIEETGSISQAAKQMKMSYKKAWEMVNTMNLQFKTPIVVGSQGGIHGGGSKLSETGRNLIEKYASLVQKNENFLCDEFFKITF